MHLVADIAFSANSTSPTEPYVECESFIPLASFAVSTLSGAVQADPGAEIEGPKEEIIDLHFLLDKK